MLFDYLKLSSISEYNAFNFVALDQRKTLHFMCNEFGAPN